MRQKTLLTRMMLLVALVLMGAGTANAADKWVKTDPADLATGDIVVIVDQTSSRAMSNDASNAAPSATSVTLSSDQSEITSTVTATLQWEVTVDNGSYQFGVGEDYLYCTNTNNGVRVGTNSNNAFVIKVADANNTNDYLYNSATSRYIGVYNNSDWRCYTTVNNNIKNTVVAFYKKTTASGPVDPSVTISSETIATGGTATISGPEGLTMSFESDDETIATVSNAGVVTGVAAGTATITASWNAVANTYNAGSKEFTVTVVAATIYEKVTDATQLVAGNEYIIVAPDYNRAMGAQNGSIRGYVDVTISNDDKVAITDEEVTVLTLGGTTDAWTFLASDNSLYLAMTSSSNALHTSDDPTDEGSQWTVTSDFMLQNNAYTTRILKYNSGSPRFACYTSGQQDAVLFVKSGSASDTRVNPELSFSETEVNAAIGAAFTPPTLNTATGFNGTVVYSSSDESVAQIMDIDTGEIRLVAEGTTTITATFAGNDDFKAGSASYTLIVTDSRIATTITQDDIVLDISEVGTLTQLAPVVKDANDNVVAYDNTGGLPEVYFNLESDNNSIIGSLDGNGAIMLNSVAGTATIKAYYNMFNENATYKPSNCTFTITVEDPDAPGHVNNPYTVAQAIDATPASGQSDFVYIKGIVSSFYNTSIVDDGTNYRYYISDDGTTTTQLLIYKGKGLNETTFSNADDLRVGDEVVVYGKLAMYQSAPEVVAGNYLKSWKRSDTTPSFEVSPNSVEATAAGTSGTINVTYINIPNTVPANINWYTDAEGTTTTDAPSWITISFDNSNNVTYEIAENTGEARTAYMKLYVYFDSKDITYYSELVTFTQAAPIVLKDATLPFEYDGNGTGELPDGLTQEGLGTKTYSSSPKIGFDTTGDYLLLKFNERPGKLTFDIKGNSFSGGTFKVQTSEDGNTFTDLRTYSSLESSTQNEVFNDLDENIRYIRWIYTEKVSGNVALGNINLAKYTAAVSSITVDPATVNVDAADNYGTLDLDYENLTITKKEDFAVQFYDEYNQELTGSNVPDWILVEVEEQAGSGYVVSYIVNENDGAARTAYFEVLALGDADYVYSNLVTINQAASAAPVVFAGFYESFDNCAKAGGNDNYWSGVTTSGVLSNFDDNDGWTYFNENPAYSCARFGTSKNNGYAQTPALKLDQSSTYVLTFKAGAWKDASTTLTLTATDAVFDGSSTITIDMVNQKWTAYYLELTAGSATTTVKFASTGRFFLDEVRVMEKSAYEALTATKSVGSNGWATYVPDYNVEFTDGDAFVVTAVDETKREATLTAVTKVPAKTPVLLKGTGEKTATVLSDASVAAPDNMLTVSNGTALSSGNYNWVLAKNGESACFKEWTGDDATLNGKVVLVLGFAAGSSARPLNFIFDDETVTGIANLNVNDNDNQVFDLQGRRVAQPQKGLYIVNGKKVVIK